MSSETCTVCGSPLEICEGECYCPDCTYYQTAREVDRATDEALALLAVEHAAFPESDAGELPF
jgi:uncharacterized Zn finger protein (UPF0148 family)